MTDACGAYVAISATLSLIAGRNDYESETGAAVTDVAPARWEADLSQTGNGRVSARSGRPARSLDLPRPHYGDEGMGDEGVRQ